MRDSAPDRRYNVPQLAAVTFMELLEFGSFVCLLDFSADAVIVFLLFVHHSRRRYRPPIPVTLRMPVYENDDENGSRFPLIVSVFLLSPTTASGFLFSGVQFCPAKFMQEYKISFTLWLGRVQFGVLGEFRFQYYFCPGFNHPFGLACEQNMRTMLLQ